MSSFHQVLQHPVTGAEEKTWRGFSWPCLFFGVFWFVYKSLWAWALVSLAICVVTGGLAWLVFPFFANKLHRESLAKAGWMPEDRAREVSVSPETHVRCPECRELVRKDARKCRHCGAALVPVQ